MTKADRRVREKEEMRQLILDAALKLFIEEGYGNVSIRRIAERIEYSPSSIYLYFEDKDAILFALHDSGFAKFYQKQLSIQELQNPKERLKAHGKVYVEFAIENPEYYDLMFISDIPAKKICEYKNWELGYRTFEILKENIAQCVEAGYFSGLNIDIVALGMWSYVHGLASLKIKGRLQNIPDETFNSITEPLLLFLERTF